jgi:hypothetical protein
MKKVLLITTLALVPTVGLNARARVSVGDATSVIADVAYDHSVYSDLIAATEHCPLVLDMKAFDKKMPVGVMAMVKALNVTEQGEAWFSKRDDDFKNNPAKECAEAEKTYGSEGMSLLKKK